jgi:AraC-type DNA-binding domain-containing proteins
MELITNLFTLAEQGLAFHGEIKVHIGSVMENLKNLDDFKKLLSILDILHELSQSKEVQILNAEKFAISTEISDQNRINKIFNYVKNNFQQPIPLETVSSLTGMTEPSFCRYFKKTTSKTFTQFVNEYRLVHASKLLAEKQLAISDIAFEAGFQNVSHFTRLFKQFAGMPPSTYRHEMKNIIST